MAYCKVFSSALLAIFVVVISQVQSCPLQNGNGQTVVSQNVVNNGNNGLYGGALLNSNLGGIGCGYPNQIISSNPVGILGTQNVISTVAQPLGYANTYPYGLGGLSLGYGNDYGLLGQAGGQLAVQNVAVTNNNCPSCGCQGSVGYPYGNYGSCNSCGKVVVV